MKRRSERVLGLVVEMLVFSDVSKNSKLKANDPKRGSSILRVMPA